MRMKLAPVAASKDWPRDGILLFDIYVKDGDRWQWHGSRRTLAQCLLHFRAVCRNDT
jgi:hypothetical protein